MSDFIVQAPYADSIAYINALMAIIFRYVPRHYILLPTNNYIVCFLLLQIHQQHGSLPYLFWTISQLKNTSVYL